jgi:hypothetical protein
VRSKIEVIPNDGVDQQTPKLSGMLEPIDDGSVVILHPQECRAHLVFQARMFDFVFGLGNCDFARIDSSSLKCETQSSMTRFALATIIAQLDPVEIIASRM